MGTHLKAVRDFCENGLKTNKIVPLSFNFPSFKINDEMFKETVHDVVADRVRLGIDSGTYKEEVVSLVSQQVEQGLKTKEYGEQYKSFIRSVSYDSLVLAQEAAEKGITTREQNNENIFSAKLLPREIMRDDNLNYNELGKKTLNEICVGRMKDCLMHIDHLHTFCAPYEENVAETINEKCKFAATMILLKEQIPSAFRQVTNSLANYPNQSLVNGLMELVKKPNIFIAHEINEIDPRFAEKNFPREMKEIHEGNKIKNMFK